MFLFFLRFPTSINSLCSDFSKEFWRGILGCVRDYFGEGFGRLLVENNGKSEETNRTTIQETIEKNTTRHIKALNSLLNDRGVGWFGLILSSRRR